LEVARAALGRPAMRKIHLLPNAITLGNAFLGLLAISKGIDALAFADGNPELFYGKLEAGCLLVFLAMVFDALDGKIARLTRSASDFGAQLDSFADALTFGVAPAVLAKVLVDHEGELAEFAGHPRLHFLAAAAFALMAILRLARFNLETDHDEEAHDEFKGLPSPAAAGAVVSWILMYLSLRSPAVEVSEGRQTLFGGLLAAIGKENLEPLLAILLPGLVLMLPVLGLLMVSRLRYAHLFSMMTRGGGQFWTLVWLTFGAFALYAAKTLVLFLLFNGFVLFGVVTAAIDLVQRRRAHAGDGAHP
jgi:CDP-diacylglycerol--serine O-phosphatidyltransferase